MQGFRGRPSRRCFSLALKTFTDYSCPNRKILMGTISHKTMDAIECTLGFQTPLTADEIHTRVGWGKIATIQRGLSQLVEEGRIVREGKQSKPTFRKLAKEQA